jgi:thiamine biosynthesis lipoprotein
MLGFACVLSVSVSHSAVSLQNSALEFTQIHMGLPVRVVLYARDRQQAEAAARAAFARVAQLDRMMSDYRPDSELRSLQNSDGHQTVSPELLTVLHRAVEIARATDGAFDPTVAPLVALWREARRTNQLPDAVRISHARASVGWQHLAIDRARSSIRLGLPGMRLDLGGIAKGYILQEALRALRGTGVTRALLESGGDIVVGDAPPGRDGWHIDVSADPVFTARASCLTNGALATSGPTTQFVEIDGVRYSHIIDPRTGLGVTSHVIARVIAKDAATADALATALTVLGERGAAWIQTRFPDVRLSISLE